MRQFLRGERLHALLLVGFAVGAVGAVVLVTVVFLTRADAADARRAAKADRAALVKVTGALRQQCAQQLTEQTSLRDLEQADIELQRGLIAADAHNRLIPASVRTARRAVYKAKLARDRQFLATPRATPAVCAVFSEPLPIAFRAVG